MQSTHTVYGLGFGDWSISLCKQRHKPNTKDAAMNTHINIETPTQAEIDRIIQRAHRMRSEYLARSINSGLSRLYGVFRHKKPVSDATT